MQQKNQKKYDFLIVGSSPIQLMMAIALSYTGKKILIVEQSGSLGGAWKYITLGGESYETSCHLIENYPRVYQVLEEYSGISFKNEMPEPVALLKSGKKIKYKTGGSYIKEFSKLLVIFTLLKTPLISRYIKKLKRKDSVEYYLRLTNWWKYKKGNVINFKGIYYPKGGYVVFLNGLIKNIEKMKIDLVHDKLLDIEAVRGDLHCHFESGGSKNFDKVYVSDSFFLTFLKKDIKLKKYWHVLISIDNEAEFAKLPKYIHFPDDDCFHRISITGDKAKHDKILLQTRVPPSEIKNLLERLNAFLLLGLFNFKQRDFSIIKEIEEFYPISNFKNSDVDERFSEILKTGKIVRVESNGDLALNVAKNSFLLKG